VLEAFAAATVGNVDPKSYDLKVQHLAAEILKLHYETLSPSTTVRMACFENIATRLTGAGKGLHLIDFWMNPPFPGIEVAIRQAARDSGDQLRDESLNHIGDAIDVCARP
jgi:hypothetical protein